MVAGLGINDRWQGALGINDRWRAGLGIDGRFGRWRLTWLTVPLPNAGGPHKKNRADLVDTLVQRRVDGRGPARLAR